MINALLRFFGFSHAEEYEVYMIYYNEGENARGCIETQINEISKKNLGKRVLISIGIVEHKGIKLYSIPTVWRVV